MTWTLRAAQVLLLAALLLTLLAPYAATSTVGDEIDASCDDTDAQIAALEAKLAALKSRKSAVTTPAFHTDAPQKYVQLPGKQSTPCTPEDDTHFQALVKQNGDPSKREWVCLPRPPSHTAPRVKFANEIFPSRLSEDPYEINQFNLTASEKLPSNRKVPETRERACLTKEALTFPKILPSLTVVVCFYNEARSTLYRTVRSILDRTPKYLLDEIILVDDNGVEPEQGDIVLGMEKVRILRNEKREGLIRSRVRGANAARSDVIVFLDSHCECQTQWAEPLLMRIKENYRVVVAPVIDVIDHSNFNYLGSTADLRGGFSWNFNYQWHPERPGRPSRAHAISTPVISGGLFGISRAWFDEIGQYDMDMETWGGENFEISFRVWQCGGKLEIVPCSRVGHVYRLSTPYSFGEDGNPRTTIDRNLARVAEVWLDEYKEHFYQFRGSVVQKFRRGELNMGDLTKRFALRKRLQCNNFSWYIANVFPELGVPGRNLLGWGRIRQNVVFCIDSHRRAWNSPERTLSTVGCNYGDHEPQEFMLMDTGLLKYCDGMGRCHCVGVTNNGVLQIEAIPDDDFSNQKYDHLKWRHDQEQRLMNLGAGLCIDSIHSNLADPLEVAECDDSSSQQWEFTGTSGF